MFNEKNKSKLMNHLNKKGAKDLDPLEKEAKLGVVSELSRQAHSMLGDKINPSKKVTVASDSKEGIKAGLAKAAGLVDHSEDPGHDPEKIQEEADEAIPGDNGDAMAEGSAEEEAMESPQEEEAELEAEHADKSPEELDAHIEKLIALKHKKQTGRA